MWKKLFGKNDADVTLADFETNKENLPRHVAIIMDGNGRWAKKRAMPRTFGHQQGVETLKEIVRFASDVGIGFLTVYAFSTENWRRPSSEVDFLMKLFKDFLDREINELHENNVKLNFIGDITALSATLQETFAAAEEKTAANDGLVFNVAVNYGGRAEIIRAVKKLAAKVETGEIGSSDINEAALAQELYTFDQPDPDLLIRPSGDYRISNFLLWQLAYTEFWFSETLWPDFSVAEFTQAIATYQKRERRFGGIKR